MVFILVRQPRSQGLSSLTPLVVGTETLVAAGHVTIYPSKTAGLVGTPATRVSVPTTKGGREERPWERGCWLGGRLKFELTA